MLRWGACGLLVLASLLLAALPAPGLTASVSPAFDAAAAEKDRPVSRVVALLRDMLKQLEEEADKDEEIYDKLACWCETSDKEKTQSISTGEGRITELDTKIEELTAASVTLSAEVKNLQKEVVENQEALDKATALREKQAAEFKAEEKDLLESISALKIAILVLSKHHSGSLMQIPRSHMLSIAATLQNEMNKHASLLRGVLTHSERKAVALFVQAPTDYFDAAPTFKQSYAPQSGEIFGILKQMKETFELNLSAAQKEELDNQKTYEDLKAAKEEVIAAGQAQIKAKTGELADTDEKNAQSKVDREDTKATLSADKKFLMMVKEKCQMTDWEWEERQKVRKAEMEAVSKAVAMLSGDDARELFERTLNPVLLQSGSTARYDRREGASRVLSRAASKLHSPRLSALAYQVKLDAFTRVKKAIDDMVAELLQEKADEIKHRDSCVDEFHGNQLGTQRKEHEEKDLTSTIEGLEMTITGLNETIGALEADIAEMREQLKRAGEDRDKEQLEFRTTVADQREMQELLKSALKVLADVYNKSHAAALVQKHVAPPPPAGFKSYQKNVVSGSVMAMLEEIINKAKALEVEAMNSEDKAKFAYEAFVQETSVAIQAKSDDVVEKSQAKAKADEELVEAKESKETVVLELEQLSNYNAQLHQSCDYILKNFDLRQAARDEEVEALKQAKAMLSGAKFEEFLQGR